MSYAGVNTPWRDSLTMRLLRVNSANFWLSGLGYEDWGLASVSRDGGQTGYAIAQPFLVAQRAEDPLAEARSRDTPAGREQV